MVTCLGFVKSFLQSVLPVSLTFDDKCDSSRVSKNSQSVWCNPPLGTLDTPDMNTRKDDKGEGRKVFRDEGRAGDKLWNERSVSLCWNGKLRPRSCFGEPRNRGLKGMLQKVSVCMSRVEPCMSIDVC